MVIRKLSTVLAVVAVGAAGGMIGTSLVANAGSVKAPLTDKTIYGKANLTFGVSDTTATNTPKTVLRIKIHAPAAGQVDVVINTSMWTDFPASGGSTLFAIQTFGRCGAPDTMDPADGCSNITGYYFQKPANTSSSDITLSYALSAQLNLSGPGNRFLYLNARSAGYVGGLYDASHVQVAFTPKNPISNSAVVTVETTA